MGDYPERHVINILQLNIENIGENFFNEDKFRTIVRRKQVSLPRTLTMREVTKHHNS